MRGTNHHGKGNPLHNRHEGFNSPHIDKSKSKHNIFWTWNGGLQGKAPDIRQSELDYYNMKFSDALDMQNQKHRARRQYKRVRTMDDVYRDKQRQPEESLLYIGDKSHLDDISTDMLWNCAMEYLAWEASYSQSHGGFYTVLSASLHADERGQIHIHERGVYQYQDDSGNWQIGQAAALDAAGIALPEPGMARSKTNNRKMSWDAMRREKWLDIIESHGFEVEREPETPRPHLSLEAWQGVQDAMTEIRQKSTEIDKIRQQATVEIDKICKMRIDADRERETLNRRRQQLEDWERELDASESALEAREAIIKQKEAVMTELGRKRYQEALKRHQEERAEARQRQAEAEFNLDVSRGRKRAGKHQPNSPEI